MLALGFGDGRSAPPDRGFWLFGRVSRGFTRLLSDTQNHSERIGTAGGIHVSRRAPEPKSTTEGDNAQPSAKQSKKSMYKGFSIPEYHF
ncbi:hypothetical protein KCP70_17145 [Salmonella enterica subsp. enterica]|nr:hypothetical protein KCP70_17145 [Salmonella enterica subsp. enterica]